MERAPGATLDTAMRLLMRKNSVYIAFIFAGAIVGERVVDYGINKVWERNNVGKRYQDIPKLGSKVE
ncbi:cytochrome b-c1 complex subunit 9, mitochondrial [Physcomitrium patens]|uniref:Complex III subunit 9 n=1 Tax=Physcomitrium patens TaxID=3218 RepID=A0A2K1KA25_PHYPA|nr:cytochrome b-c1 complex subunit 9-like [Physcomitrium patens]PNR50622.1 hypothetical protein PHYPA_009808 [Physcomitrium patens]|eukprot:XP_024379949.1 cytochrome b-c1 complex subunit 9-like [Physcomitrella patens]